MNLLSPRMGWLFVAFTLAVAALLGSATTFAQEPPTGESATGSPVGPTLPITVTTDSPTLLMVNGLPASTPTTEVLKNAQVCVQQPVKYLNQRERWVFLGWSHGPELLCVTLSTPGVYRAIFDHEFVIHIRSDVGEIRESKWVRDGSTTKVEVPEIVEEGDRVRFRFVEWGEGETPFSPENVIAPLGPMDLEPTWVKEYFVTIEGPDDVELEGSGWYENDSILVLRAPQIIETGGQAGVRTKFASWRSVGVPVLAIPDAELPSTAIAVEGPYTVKATYEKEFLVTAQSPFGVLTRQWVREGEAIVIEAPAVQETIAGEQRFVFRRWLGQEGLTSPSVTGIANQPINLTASYERQYMVLVESAFGSSGGGWHPAGSIATVSVPEEVGFKLVFKRSFNGFAGYPQDRSSIDFSVDQHVVVTAIYNTKVNVGILVLLLLIPLAAVVLFFANRWIMLLIRGPRRMRQGARRMPASRRQYNDSDE